jgi:hypothetical protein
MNWGRLPPRAPQRDANKCSPSAALDGALVLHTPGLAGCGAHCTARRPQHHSHLGAKKTVPMPVDLEGSCTTAKTSLAPAAAAAAALASPCLALTSSQASRMPSLQPRSTRSTVSVSVTVTVLQVPSACNQLLRWSRPGSHALT